MTHLTNVFAEFKKIGFPHSPVTEDLEEIFTDLIQYDSYISGTIEKLLKGKFVQATDLYFDDELEGKISNFIIEAKSSKEIECAQSYLVYLGYLKELIKAGQEQG